LQLDYLLGCLLGGAVGDALGAAVEFLSLEQIRSQFGPTGIDRYVETYGRKGAITDDTQMTLWTAEGLIRADNRGTQKGIADIPSMVWDAYQRWLWTQLRGEPRTRQAADTPRDGWLIQQSFLHHRRAPGTTNLSALMHGQMGRITHPVTNSKGCGGVMRVAPVGLSRHESFGLGCAIAALTHGHPTGYLAAGAMAQIVSSLAGGASCDDAIAAALVELARWPMNKETAAAIERARIAARREPPTPETIQQLGAGWVAEEALAIGLFCALASSDFETGILLAINHGGDSDSTGAIAGSLLGVKLGQAAIPTRFLDELEGREIIEQIANDLANHFDGERRELVDDLDRYPPH
jgi:ADP-ribosylglycohydrolase